MIVLQAINPTSFEASYIDLTHSKSYPLARITQIDTDTVRITPYMDSEECMVCNSVYHAHKAIEANTVLYFNRPFLELGDLK